MYSHVLFAIVLGIFLINSQVICIDLDPGESILFDVSNL